MKIKNIFTNTVKVFALSTLLLSGACSTLLDTQPTTSIDAASALNSEADVKTALAAVYAYLRSPRQYGRDLVAFPEALADNGIATNKSGRFVGEYNNQPFAHFANWQTAYFGINQANIVIDAAEKVKMPATSKDKIQGEAKFLRALYYFNLMRTYAYDPNAVVAVNNKGGVPLLTVGVLDISAVTYPTRASIDDVYTQIIKDLLDAITSLPARAAVPHYATGGAANALLSRVYLNKGDWANAAKYATSALASNMGAFVSNGSYVSSWRVPVNPESMFEVLYQIAGENVGVNESLQTSYTTLVTVGNRTTTGGFGDLVPTDDLLNNYRSEPNDIRLQLYELGTAGRGAARTECTKFMGKNGQINWDNTPVIRISEMYLNRAEALAMSGDAAGALTDLNVIRVRAGLTAQTGLSGQALIDAILKQRRLEFAFEGHRWFDLKRRGLDVKKLPLDIAATDTRILANIPAREIQVNPKLVQNAGY